jgi:excisionase family DNA binding protein
MRVFARSARQFFSFCTLLDFICIDRYFLRVYKTSVMALITTSDAAKKLGVHQTRVQVLIREGRLPAQMIGGTYVIEESNLALVAERKAGRPKKEIEARVQLLTKAAQKGMKKGGKK